MPARFHTRRHVPVASGRPALGSPFAPASAPAFTRFTDRRAAGRVLAGRLAPLVRPDAVVVGLAGGGAVVAEEVARALEAPLDVLVVEPVIPAGHPTSEVGALAAGGTLMLDDTLITGMRLTPFALRTAVERVRGRVARRLAACLAGAPPLDVQARDVVLVDEVLDSRIVATAAVACMRDRGAARVVLAAPVADGAVVASARADADEVVAVLLPAASGRRTRWYERLPVVSDAEVAGTVALRPAPR